MRALLATAILFGALAAPASATDVVVDDGTGRVNISADPTAADPVDLSVATSGTQVVVTANGATTSLTPEGACTGTATTVSCPGTTVGTVLLTPFPDALRAQGLTGAIVEAFGFAGKDLLVGGSNEDVLLGGAGDDVLDGGPSKDLLYGQDGGDLLKGRDGDDLLIGDSDPGDTGADTFEGGLGVDKVTYFFSPVGVTASLDGVRNDGDGDLIGDDVEALEGSKLNDKLTGSALADTLRGSAGNDELDGLGGADELIGGNGDDVLAARDDRADQTVQCDGDFADTPGSAGLADRAVVDLADPPTAGCETTEKPAAPPAPAPAPPGPSPEPPADAVLVPGTDAACPALFRLALRSEVDADLLTGGRVGLEVDVPFPGWAVRVSAYDPLDRTTSAPDTTAIARAPGRLRVPVAFRTSRAGAAPKRIVVSAAAIAPGCPVLESSDTIEVEPRPDGRLETLPRATLRQAGSTRVVDGITYVAGGIDPQDAREDKLAVDCGVKNERFQDYAKITDSTRFGIGRWHEPGGWVCIPWIPKVDRCEEAVDVPRLPVVRLTAKCLKKVGDVYTTTEWVQVNGVRLDPQGELTFDPARATLKTARAKLTVPQLRDGKLLPEPLVLHDGKVGTIALGQEVSLLGGEKTVGGKLVGFKLVGDATAKLNGTGGMQLALRVELPDTWNGVQGRVAIDVSPQGADVRSANLFVPKLEYKGFTVQDLRLRYLLRAKDGKAVFSVEKANIDIPVAPGLKRVAGATVEVNEVTFVDGRLEKFEIKLGVDFKLKLLKLAKAVTLKELRAAMDLQKKPGFLEGSTIVTLGPSIGALDLVALSGRMGFDFGAVPKFYIRDAVFSSLGTQRAGGDFSFRPYDGWTTFGGAAEVSAGLMQYVGRVRGEFIPDVGFEAYGRGVLNFFGQQLGRADIKYRQVYAAACGYSNIAKMTVGVLFRYEDPIRAVPMQGCGFAEFGETGGRPGEANPGRPTARAAAAVKRFDVPKGLPKAAFTAIGATSAPDVALVAPDGRRITAPTIADGVFAISSGNAVTFAVNKPAAGTWTLDAAEGSVPVVDAQFARGLDPPVLRGARVVRAPEGKRALEVTIDAPASTEVTFWEEPVDFDTNAVPTLIGKAKPGRRTLTFTPAEGQGGLREVRATVEQDGLPAGESKVIARYRAAAGGPPGKPCVKVARNPFFRESRITIGAVGDPSDGCALKVARDGTTLDISWNQSKDAIAHRVTVSVSDGRRDVLLVGPRTTTLTYRDVAREDGARVSVVGVDELDRTSVAARATIDDQDLKVRKPVASSSAAPDDLGVGTVFPG